MDGQRYEGRVALVTGAGSGIGQAVAARLAAEGCVGRRSNVNGAVVAADGGFTA